MGALVYGLCATAALGCAALLLRGYRRTRLRLLLWSGLCFALLTVNNALVTIDLAVLPGTDLFLFRNLTALSGVGMLLFGLVWENR